MDLNGLISTIISSTAALVAIIGGFLVSRVITLSGEKNGILKKIKEIDKELEIKNSLYESAKQVVQDEDIDDFVREYAEEILFNQKSVESILEEDYSINIERDIIDSTLAKVAKIFEFIVKRIQSTDDRYSLPSDFNEFTRDNEIKINEDRSWHELIYDLVLSHIPQQQSSFPYLNLINSVSDLNKIKPILSTQEYNANVSKVKALEDDIKVLKALRSAEDDMLKGYGKISGLWGGLAVLIYACVVGIIIPSFLLPYPLNYYDDSATRMTLLILFVSELIAIFSYLGFAMLRLTKHDSYEDWVDQMAEENRGEDE